MLIEIASVAITVAMVLVSVALLGHREEKKQTASCGRPTVDEYVTRPMLEITRICAALSAGVYRRVEDLPSSMSAAAQAVTDHRSRIVDFESHVITNQDHSAVVVITREQVGERRVFVTCRGTNISNWRQVLANLFVRKVDFLNHCFWRDDVRVRQLPDCLQDAIKGLNNGLLADRLGIGRVHRGVAELFNADGVGWRVIRALEADVQSERPIILGGHSQGFGWVQLIGIAMRWCHLISVDQRWMATAMVGFGGMRAGDRRVASQLELVCVHRPDLGLFGMMKYRNRRDVVPVLPKRWMGYADAGMDLQITQRGHVRRKPLNIVRIGSAVRDFSRGRWFRWLKHHPMDNYVAAVNKLQIPAWESERKASS